MSGITKRIDLNLGYTCNINCRFCYYQESKEAHTRNLRKDLTREEAVRWLLFFRRKGKTAVDLTGGEPTIRKDLPGLIEYARSIGYTTVCVITNGLRMSDAAYTRRLVSAGLNDCLLSLHGHDVPVHENLTQTPGSYDRVISAIRNVMAEGISCRTNTTVNGVNYRYVPEVAAVVYGLGVRVANFIMFNPIVEAQSSGPDMNVSYAEAAPFLKKTIDAYKDRMRRITVRYMPFCLMAGYEKYVTNTAQIQYDPYEWDYLWRTFFRNGALMWMGALCLGFLIHPSKLRLARLDFETARHEAIKYALAARNKVHGPQCRPCSLRRICDGLWRDYAARKGFDELSSRKGRPVTDPAYYLREVLENNGRDTE